MTNDFFSLFYSMSSKTRIFFTYIFFMCEVEVNYTKMWMWMNQISVNENINTD